MSPVQNAPLDQTQQLADQLFEENTHFVRAVTAVADKSEVVASEDIYARSGMKLISSGTRLSGRFYDRLVEHKLLKPIEQSLSVENAIGSASLMAMLRAECEKVPSFAALLTHPGVMQRLQDAFGDSRLPAPLALRLTVALEERPLLFKDLLSAALIACLLASNDKLSRSDGKSLVLAAILHDVGEWCIDPAFLAPEHRMTPEERRHIYVHPLTGFLMLRQFPEIPDLAARAVLQHHELLDGSGYPFRLKDKDIGVVSRYMAVVGVAAALLMRFGYDRRINILLRFNRKKYDAQAVECVGKLFSDSGTHSASGPEEIFALNRLIQAGQLFDNWFALQETMLSNVSASDFASNFLIERMGNLRMTVLEAGFDPARFEDIITLAQEEDQDIRAELTILLDELAWQFKALSRELERKLFDQDLQLPLPVKAEFDNWVGQVRQFVGE